MNRLPRTSAILDKFMRRDPLKIVEVMLKALETGRPYSINELAHETGFHNVTVRRYVELIQVVRQEPIVEVIRTRHSVIIRMLPHRPEEQE